MRFLIDLPFDINLLILSQWLNIIDLCYLDKSICNKKYRYLLLSYYSNKNMILNNKQPSEIYQIKGCIDSILAVKGKLRI